MVSNQGSIRAGWRVGKGGSAPNGREDYLRYLCGCGYVCCDLWVEPFTPLLSPRYCTTKQQYFIPGEMLSVSQILCVLGNIPIEITCSSHGFNRNALKVGNE